MNEIKETIEGLKNIKPIMALVPDLPLSTINKAEDILSQAIQILEAYDQASEELGEKKEHFAFLSKEKLFPVEGFKEHRTVKDWIKFGYNQMHSKATAVVMKKNMTINSLIKVNQKLHKRIEKLERNIQEHCDYCSLISQDKELQSLKSSIIEKLEKAKFPKFTVKTSEQLNKKIDIIIKELEWTNERTN